MGWILRHLARCMSCYGCRILPCCWGFHSPRIVRTERPEDENAHAEAMATKRKQEQSSSESVSMGGDAVETVSLITFNTQLLLWHQNSKRAAHIADELLKQDADIVCLQEVFDEECRDVLLSRLRETYPYSISRCGYKAFCGLGEDSGLMMLSKFKIKKVHFTLFEDCAFGLSDSFASKGLLRADIAINEDCTLRVFTTHLYAFEEAVAIRRDQLDTIQHRVETALHNDPCKFAVLVGDFNIPGGTEEYTHAIVNRTNWVDVFAKLHPKDPGFTTTDEIPERLDYVFDTNGTLAFQDIRVDRMNLTSDHYALVTTIVNPAATKKKKQELEKADSKVSTSQEEHKKIAGDDVNSSSDSARVVDSSKISDTETKSKSVDSAAPLMQHQPDVNTPTNTEIKEEEEEKEEQQQVSTTQQVQTKDNDDSVVNQSKSKHATLVVPVEVEVATPNVSHVRRLDENKLAENSIIVRRIQNKFSDYSTRHAVRGADGMSMIRSKHVDMSVYKEKEKQRAVALVKPRCFGCCLVPAYHATKKHPKSEISLSLTQASPKKDNKAAATTPTEQKQDDASTVKQKAKQEKNETDNKEVVTSADVVVENVDENEVNIVVNE